jgi:hypothetical protein
MITNVFGLTLCITNIIKDKNSSNFVSRSEGQKDY